MIRTENVLAFASRRIDTAADEVEEVHLVIRRSPDGGRTWQSLSDLFAEPGWHAAIGTVITDTNKNTIVLPYHRGQRVNSDESHHQQKDPGDGDTTSLYRHLVISRSSRGNTHLVIAEKERQDTKQQYRDTRCPEVLLRKHR